MFDAITNIITDERTRSQVLLLVVVPWTLLILHSIYHYWMRRPTVSAERIEPLMRYYQLFAAGSSRGYDRMVFELLHPALLQKADRGALRAMMRYVHNTLGPVKGVNLRSCVVKQDGLQVNAVALLAFEKHPAVKCRMLWTLRPFAQQQGKNFNSPVRFHVSAFHIDMSPLLTPSSLRIVDFLDVDDFVSIGEAFVTSVISSADMGGALELMESQLRAQHEANGGERIQAVRAKIVAALCAAGGLRGGELECVLMESEFIRAPKAASPAAKAVSGDHNTTTSDEESASEAAVHEEPKGDITGFSQEFHVLGQHRRIAFTLRLTLFDLLCKVFYYQITILPDERTNVVIDKETGEAQCIGPR